MRLRESHRTTPQRATDILDHLLKSRRLQRRSSWYARPSGSSGSFSRKAALRVHVAARPRHCSGTHRAPDRRAAKGIMRCALASNAASALCSTPSAASKLTSPRPARGEVGAKMREMLPRVQEVPLQDRAGRDLRRKPHDVCVALGSSPSHVVMAVPRLSPEAAEKSRKYTRSWRCTRPCHLS